MSPRPRKPTNARAKKQIFPPPRTSISHAHILDPRPTSIPPPILMNDDTWLYDLGARKLWVRSREPVDWKQVGTLMGNSDLGYDSDETIDDPTHPPTKAEDQSPKQQPSQQEALDSNSACRSNLPTDKVIVQDDQRKATSKTSLALLTSSSTNHLEAAYDTDATISEPTNEEDSPDQKEADRKIFQNAMRQRRAWNLENEEEGMSAKVLLPVYNTRIV